MNINAFLTAIQSDLKSHMPGLVACETHGGRFDLAELKRIAGRAPAIYIAVLGAPRTSETGTGTQDISLNLAAFVVTTDRRGLTRAESCLNIVETLLTYIPNKRWNVPTADNPEQISARNLYGGGIDSRGVALWVVGWRQTLRLGDCVWTEDGTLDPEVYLGLAPDVGLGHEEDYDRVGGDA